MSFPATPLSVLVEVFLDADLTADPDTWAATDATVLIFDRSEDQIAIGRGRPDQSRTADPSSLSMTGDNRGGHWSTKNPLSPWYGLLHKGTPVRVSAESHVRYTGFFTELPPRWDVSEAMRWVPLKALGLLYQLGLEGTPERSALRRTIEHAAPDRYWPLEDGPDALAGASAYPDGAPTNPLTGDALFTSSTIAQGSAGGIDMAGGVLIAPTGELIAAAPNGWEYSFVVGWDEVPSVPLDECRGIAHAASTGPAGQMGVGITNLSGTVYFADFISDAGSGAFAPLSGLGPIEAGRAYGVRVVGWQDGTELRLTVYVDGESVFDDGFTGTLLMPDRIVCNGSAAPTAPAADVPFFTHLTFSAPFRVSDDTWAAANGYAGEQAHDRFLRLCGEESVRATCTATESVALGPQLPSAFLPLLRELEASDQGYIYEGLDWDLVFQAHTQRELMPVALELDYTASGHVSPPLEPIDDDQDARNDVSVERIGGSSSRIEADSASEFARSKIGRRKDEQKLSLADDDLTRQVAGWRLHMLTRPGYRWPVLTINLAAGPALIDDVCIADLAYRATVANPPMDAGSSTLDLIVDGYSETIKQYEWLITDNCAPYGPWQVGILAETSGDTDIVGWLDWDSCELDTGVNTTATTWLINATPLDTTTSDDYPRDVQVGGEVVTVTACSGSSQPQTWTVTRSVNGVVKAHTAGDRIELSYPFVLGL